MAPHYCYKGIKIYERDGKFFTDGYGEQKAIITTDTRTTIPAIAQLYETCNRVLQMWKNWIQPGKPRKPPKTKFLIDPSVQDPHINDLR